MTIIIAPDKFKGSLTSLQACNAIKKGIAAYNKNIHTTIFPMADGGDGFAEVLKYYLHTETVFTQSEDALGRKISALYEWDQTNKTAIIELATCSGLAMLKKEERTPMLSSTIGTGLLIGHTISRGAEKILLGIGGSATNDAGTGILHALGFRFFDQEQKELQPNGANLIKIRSVVLPQKLPEVTIEIACDVINPMYGLQGAAYIFAPQKGASAIEVTQLDDGLKNFSLVIEKTTGKDFSLTHGAGAAGAIPPALMAFCGAQIIKGTELIINASRIRKEISNADLIITGEGKLDDQSLSGKTVSAITKMGNENRIPVIVACGSLSLTEARYKEAGIAFAFELKEENISEEESINNAFNLLSEKVQLMMPLVEKVVRNNAVS